MELALGAMDDAEKALGSLETDWEQRVAALRRLAALAETAARPENTGTRGAFVQRLCAPELRNAVALQFTDPRSAVIKALAAVLEGMSVSLRESLDPFVDAMVEPLLRLLSKKSRVVVDAIVGAMRTMLENSRVGARGVRTFALTAVNAKHPQQRACAMDFLTIVLEQASRYAIVLGADSIADVIQNAVRKAMEDGSPEVRTAARRAFVPFRRVWDDRAAMLVDSLSTSQKKYLGEAVPGAVTGTGAKSTSGAARERGGMTTAGVAATTVTRQVRSAGFDRDFAAAAAARAPQQRTATTGNIAGGNELGAAINPNIAFEMTLNKNSTGLGLMPKYSSSAETLAVLSQRTHEDSSEKNQIPPQQQQPQQVQQQPQQQKCGLFAFGNTLKKQEAENIPIEIVPKPIVTPTRPSLAVSQDFRSAILRDLERSGYQPYTAVFANNFSSSSFESTRESPQPKKNGEDGDRTNDEMPKQVLMPVTALTTITTRHKKRHNREDNQHSDPASEDQQEVNKEEQRRDIFAVMEDVPQPQPAPTKEPEQVPEVLQSLRRKDSILVKTALQSKHASERLEGLEAINEYFETVEESQKLNINTVVRELGTLMEDESADVTNTALRLLTTLIRRFTDVMEPLLPTVLPSVCRRLSASIIPKRQEELLNDLVSAIVKNAAYEILLPEIVEMMSSSDAHIVVPCLELYMRCFEEKPDFFHEYHRLIPHLSRVVSLMRSSNAQVRTLAKNLVLQLYERSNDAFVSALAAQPREQFHQFREILQPFIPTLENDLQRKNMSSGRFAARIEQTNRFNTNPTPEPPKVKPPKAEPEPLAPPKTGERVETPPITQAKTSERQQPPQPAPLTSTRTIPQGFMSESKACSGVPTIDSTLNLLKLGVEAPLPQILACFTSFLQLLHESPTQKLSEEDLTQLIDLTCQHALSDNEELRDAAISVLVELLERDITDQHAQKIFATTACLSRKLETISSRGVPCERLASWLETLQNIFETRDPHRFVRVLTQILQDATTPEADQYSALATLTLLCSHMDVMTLTLQAATIVSTVAPLMNSRNATIQHSAVACVQTCRDTLGDVFSPFLSLLSAAQLDLVNGGLPEVPQEPEAGHVTPSTTEQASNKPQTPGSADTLVPTPPHKQQRKSEEASAVAPVLLPAMMPSPIRPVRASAAQPFVTPGVDTPEPPDAAEEVPPTAPSASPHNSDSDGNGNDEDSDGGDISDTSCPSPPSDSSDW